MLRRFEAPGNPPDFTTRYPLESVDSETLDTVTAILSDVRTDGWEPVVEYSEKYDGTSPEKAPVNESRLTEAREDLQPEERKALGTARDRIRRYQEAIKPDSTLISDGASGKLAEVIRPVGTAGCYIPGGRFPLPSTVLMTALIAEIAGVQEIVVCSPPGEDRLPHEKILAACSFLDEVDVFGIGGIQAIGAMAYGAGDVPAVDVIAGPGNLYVTLAKKQVYGRVGIDLLAGPSEICVVAESGSTRPEWVAADLLSQAEHDPDSRVYAISPDEALLDDVEGELSNLLDGHPDPDPVREALENSALVAVEDLDEAVRYSNELAPEHLELHVDNPEALARRCENAGAIFCGPHTPEPLGDYTAGPSHTLPTGGTARFFSPLSVRTFMKSQSLIAFDQGGFENLRGATETLARMESLRGHYESLNTRGKDDPRND